jgi:predicted metal-binding protein
MTHQITLCRSCPGGPDLIEVLRNALENHDYTVGETDCMSGCTRPQTVSFRAPGKTAYLFGDLGPGDLPDLTNFARLYRDSPDGTFVDARSLGALRFKAIARIPG